MRDVTPIPSALEFDNLPSDRSPGTPASRLIRELAERGIVYGPHACGAYGDQARYVQRKLRDGRGFENLPWFMRPGGFIKERFTPEVRETLSTLTSDDVEDVPLAEWMSEEWDSPGPGLRWKYGHDVTETLPTTWKVGGSGSRHE